MTDKERLLALLKDYGISPGQDSTATAVVLAAGEGKVDGYPFFQCTFLFEEDGSFKAVGVWE